MTHLAVSSSLTRSDAENTGWLVRLGESQREQQKASLHVAAMLLQQLMLQVTVLSLFPVDRLQEIGNAHTVWTSLLSDPPPCERYVFVPSRAWWRLGAQATNIAIVQILTRAYQYMHMSVQVPKCIRQRMRLGRLHLFSRSASASFTREVSR